MKQTLKLVGMTLGTVFCMAVFAQQPAPTPTTQPTPAAMPMQKTPAAPMAAPAAAAPMATAPQTQPMVSAGGPGQVWVNTKSKVYHCYGTRYYGKTAAGSYMTEDQAKATCARADHGKACS